MYKITIEYYSESPVPLIVEEKGELDKSYQFSRERYIKLNATQIIRVESNISKNNPTEYEKMFSRAGDIEEGCDNV